MIVGHIGGGESAGYEIPKSLRFRASASAYLSRTFSTTGNRKTWTWSGWVKRGALGTRQFITMSGVNPNPSQVWQVEFNANDKLEFYNGAINSYRTSTRVFRDPAAPLHLVFCADTNNATAQNRFRCWINGEEITAWDVNSTISLGYDFAYNGAYLHGIGAYTYSPSNYLDGYLSEINFIDGQALGPESFGQVNTETGQWIPKKYTGSYGTNGFYLPFNDGTNLTELTKDRSGNSNNWTATNISLTAGSTYDWMDDTPTNNFAVLNAVHAGRSTLTNGNLTASGTTDLPTILPDSGTWYFERGGVSQTWTPPAAFPSGSGDYNFGQRPFAYPPPPGFKALCTKNLPTPGILNPKKHFDVALATGANIKSTAEAVFPGNFLEWIKDRGNANNHQLIDTVRGTSAVLQSNTTGAETTYSAPSGSSVGWAWKAGGAPVTNNAGSIQSQVSANTAAGFSIVTYTGTGANATVGHGLGVTPDMVIVKQRNVVRSWVVKHKSLSGNNMLSLEQTIAQFVNSNGYLSLTSGSVFSLTNGGSSIDTVCASGGTYVAYCFAEVPGFSKIGSYTGNGSADGPFIYCGFKPRFLLVKRTDVAQDWFMWDASRMGYNQSNYLLFANSSQAEYSGTESNVDLLSNGFKIRAASPPAVGSNASGGTYIFLAFAESPFNYSTAR